MQTRIVEFARNSLILATLFLPAARVHGADITVDVHFDTVVGPQRLAYGSNEPQPLIGPSDVAISRLAELNTSWCRLWIHGTIQGAEGIWNWSLLDVPVNKVVQAGARPLVCIVGVPDWMNDPENQHDHGTSWNRPRDLQEWGQYCVTIVNHCAAQGYPVEEWMWEIWNEPDNYGSSGPFPVEDYLAIYDAAAAALRAAYPNIKVGGPATDHGKFKFIGPLLYEGHDVQFISWHKYGPMDYPDEFGVFHRPDYEYLRQTGLYGDPDDQGDVHVKEWINQYRPNEGILSVCGEDNLNPYCCPIDPKIWEPIMIAWYPSVLRHMSLGGTDIELFFTGTDKSWPNYGLFLGDGENAGLRSPAFWARSMFSSAAPYASDVVFSTDIADSVETEMFATRAEPGHKYVSFINKKLGTTTVTMNITGINVLGGIWYGMDAAAYAAGAIETEIAPAGNTQNVTLEHYELKVFEAITTAGPIDPDPDGDTVVNLLDNCRNHANLDQLDADHDGAGDACDACPGTWPGKLMSVIGCATPPVDFDRDGDVDQEDFDRFQLCSTAPGQAQTDPDCAGALLDTDDDVDDNDLAKFLQCLGASGVLAQPTCANAPAIDRQPASFVRDVVRGQNLTGDTFTIANTGELLSVLDYTIGDDADWLSVTPDRGTVTSEVDTLVVEYETASLAVGSYTGTITIEAFYGAANTPQTLVVELTVGPPPFAPCDFDEDGDVDQEDYGRFQACYSVPGVEQPAAACAGARLDQDVDVDLDDFALFQGCMSGPNHPVDTLCADP